MKVAFIVPCRNKAAWVAETVKTVLNQTYSPMQLVFSDQMSEDESFEAIQAAVEGYDGPNEVVLLQCPETEYRNMAGLNAHLNWLHENVDADIFIHTSADDLAHQDRAKRVVAAFEERGVSYVGTAHVYLAEDARTIEHQTLDGNLDSCFVPIDMILKFRFGGKTSSAWKTDLWRKYGPLLDISCQDLVIPFWAGLEDGFYYLNEPLHAYVNRPDPQNLGLEGLVRQADDLDRQRLNELMHYQMAANIERMIAQCEAVVANGEDATRKERAKQGLDILYHQLLMQCGGWVQSRHHLTRERIEPMGFPV